MISKVENLESFDEALSTPSSVASAQLIYHRPFICRERRLTRGGGSDFEQTVREIGA